MIDSTKFQPTVQNNATLKMRDFVWYVQTEWPGLAAWVSGDERRKIFPTEDVLPENPRLVLYSLSIDGEKTGWANAVSLAEAAGYDNADDMMLPYAAMSIVDGTPRIIEIVIYDEIMRVQKLVYVGVEHATFFEMPSATRSFHFDERTFIHAGLAMNILHAKMSGVEHCTVQAFDEVGPAHVQYIGKDLKSVHLSFDYLYGKK